MTDIAIVNNGGTSGLEFDWVMAFGDLVKDDGLKTAVEISLFTDRLAQADDNLPDNTGDRRGWWGDLPLNDVGNGTPDYIGSRLWLLSREKATAKTAARAKNYAIEALQWLIDDGVADKVDVTTAWLAREALQISVSIIRQSGTGAAVNHRFDAVWRPVVPLPPGPPPITVLDTESGSFITTESGDLIAI